jgi:hypothetical protein
MGRPSLAASVPAGTEARPTEFFLFLREPKAHEQPGWEPLTKKSPRGYPENPQKYVEQAPSPALFKNSRGRLFYNFSS